MNSREVIRLIEADGWFRVAHKGSHMPVFKHAAKAVRVTVPHPSQDIPTGTLRGIERQARMRFR